MQLFTCRSEIIEVVPAIKCFFSWSEERSDINHTANNLILGLFPISIS